MRSARRRAAAGILAILGWVAVAWAEDTPQAPPATRELADGPFQLVLPSEHLLGSWLGTRTWLEERGVTPTVSFVTDALGNPTGGMRQGFRGASNLGLDLRFDLDRLFGLAGGTFEISFSERFGSSLSQEDIGNVFTVQQVFGGQTYRLVNVAYQQRLPGDRVQLQVGRIAAGDDFLVSPYNDVFVQNGFDGNPVGIFFNAPGMTAYPNATWGGLVKVKPTERSYVMGGLYNGDPSIRDNDHHGADWSMGGPIFAIGEAGYQFNGLPGERGLLGNYKVGFWYDDSQYTDFNSVARGIAPRVSRGNWARMPCSTRWWWSSAGPAATEASGSRARFSSRATSPSARCRSFPPPASSCAASFRRGRRTWGESASCTVTSATTCRTRSGARPPACSGTRSRSS